MMISLMMVIGDGYGTVVLMVIFILRWSGDGDGDGINGEAKNWRESPCHVPPVWDFPP
jgi:hypothetical protein